MSVGQGSDRQGLVEVLLTLGRLGRTGILTIQGENNLIGLSFLNGEIVASDALNQSLEEGLGEILASRGSVSLEDYALLVAEYEAGGGRVVDLLIERRFVNREELLEALRWHIYFSSRKALSWSTCEFKFYEGDEVSYEVGITPLKVEELLVRAMDDLGEEAPLPGRIPAADAVVARIEGPMTASGRDELLLGLATGDTEGTTELLTAIDGQGTVAQLANRVGASEFETRLALYLLERAGQVRITSGREVELARQSLGPAESTTAGVEAGRRGRGDRKRSSLLNGKLGVEVADWLPWIPRALSAVMTILLVWVVATEPSVTLLPFPWQEGLRQAVLAEQTSAAYLKIDRAAKTSFLLNGHFPEALEVLAQEGLLTSRDLTDPAGRRLGYAAQVAGYLVYPLDEGDPAPGASRTEAITGNFLLDPEFVPARSAAEPPLILLD